MNQRDEESNRNKQPQSIMTEYKKPQKHKKTTITLALDDYLVQEIRRDAKELNQSLNIRINAILEKHVKFYRMTESSGSAVMHPALVQFIIREIDESKFVENWKTLGTSLIESFFVQKGIPITLDNFINYYLELASYAGVIKSASRYIDAHDGKTCCFLLHGYDSKWSRIIGAAYASQIEYLMKVHTSLKLFSDGVEIKIMEANVI